MFVWGLIGYVFAAQTGDRTQPALYIRGVIALALLGAGFGILVTPYLTTIPFRYFRRLLQDLPAEDLFAAIVGMTIGLVMSALLALPLSSMPDPFNKLLPFGAAIGLSYAGAAVLVMRERELFSIIFRVRRPDDPENGAPAGMVLLDTSSIIDGRIAEVATAGFMPGRLVVPSFVLDELQQISDSAEAVRRNKGRYGLDVLNRMRHSGRLAVEVMEVDYDDLREVDAKLVRLGRTLRAPIVTLDFNLNRVASIQGLAVLNVNELAEALKLPVVRGEELSVKIIQKGTEAGQGVGFLEDGTMVVVEDALPYMGQEVVAVVKNVVNKPAGRMIFAYLKGENGEAF